MARGLKVGILAAIGLIAADTALSQTLSPVDAVCARFKELDSQGEQLTPDGWQRVAALFVNPGKPQLGKILVIDGGGLLRSTPERTRAEFKDGKGFAGWEYVLWGQINLPEVRFSEANGLPPGIKVKEESRLTRVPGPSGVPEWRIEGPVPVPRLTVESATRYVTEVRANTKDATVRKNADRTLAILKQFR